MKEKKELIEKLIDVQIGYYRDREEVRKYLEDQPVVLSMLEAYTERISDITEIIIQDILEIPDEPRNNEYNRENWKRDVTRNIINYTIINDGEYRESVIELIMDWENLLNSTQKVESHSWFYYQKLLHEHSEGFPEYQKVLEEEEKEKKKRTKKTTA
ncbi:hypothetical protein [Priestia megaterium]|uniref:hypothetical protein n=1 Tax=Priestia megaterium TaxID=1404 RepID=UPI001EDBA7A7|nr:hypothetical protein [Priestia megaterium]MDR7246321.1 hypothetical protein [Priestia megaterium]UKJ81188.1 hypothetical protein H1W83_02255 [Priestia megaterium]